MEEANAGKKRKENRVKKPLILSLFSHYTHSEKIKKSRNQEKKQPRQSYYFLLPVFRFPSAGMGVLPLR